MLVLTFCVLSFTLTVAAFADQTQIEKYDSRFKKYKLDVPGKEPITIVETSPIVDRDHWIDIPLDSPKVTDSGIKNYMTDIIHDANGGRPRCFGPSCQEGFVEDEGPQGELEEFLADYADGKDYRDDPNDRMQAISALAAKLKNTRQKDRYSYGQDYDSSLEPEDDQNKKVFTSWNKLKVKQHKHPFDDKDGWVSLEPVAWSTSKISKWKPNIKKHTHKPSMWSEDHDDNRYPTNNDFNDDQNYSGYQGMAGTQPTSTKFSQKRPMIVRPSYINNKLHVTSSSSSSDTSDWDNETPRPTWNKPQSTYHYPSSWNPDEGRRPHKPNCEHDENYHSDEAVLYGLSDSVVTDSNPSHFPYEYEALKRPMRRPTQVVYAGSSEVDSNRASRPPHGDGQWILLSTTKGYRNKKRPRSLSLDPSEKPDSTMTSHQAVSLTVLPMENAHLNMTTSHGGLLEVERSFQTVEEAKRDMDKKNEIQVDLSVAPETRPFLSVANENRPIVNKIVKKIISPTSMGPDRNSVLAAVGAGMLPATMAMVVPMMLGRRKRRDVGRSKDDHILVEYRA